MVLTLIEQYKLKKMDNTGTLHYVLMEEVNNRHTHTHTIIKLVFNKINEEKKNKIWDWLCGLILYISINEIKYDKRWKNFFYGKWNLIKCGIKAK